MNSISDNPAQLGRELAFYRRECNDLGARLLRLQEEQSQAFREARRSRTVAKLIREAYRLADLGSTTEAIGGPLLEVIVDNALCDRAALLRQVGGPDTDPDGVIRFSILHAVGLRGEMLPTEVVVRGAPGFFFTTARTPIEPPAYEISSILRVPYVLWCWDRVSGYALVLGNHAEGNVTRPFELADQELVEGALSVYIDVLLRKHNEIELRQAKATAEEASAARVRFVATLSHELRTPLNAIIGFSDLLTADLAMETGQRRQYAAQILESGRGLLMLIDDILDYSQLARLTPHLDSKWLAATALLQAAAAEAAAVARQRGITLELDAPAPVPELHVDRRRLHQVLNNLVSNALKFTPRHGAVSLGVKVIASGVALITVRDTGVGMPTEDIPRAMEPFRQLDNGNDRSFSGTGLGLPIARGLAEAHGGTLSIESAPGKGTTVAVVIPAHRVRWPA